MAPYDRSNLRKRPGIIVLAAIAAFLSFTFFFFSELSNQIALKTSRAATSGSRLFGEVVLHAAPLRPTRPKISIILVWMDRGTAPPRYLPYFFQSVEANPEVDLLFINVDKYNKGCTNHSDAQNVKQICLKEDEYHLLHVDFLCERWHCRDEDRVILMEGLRANSDHDGNNSFFRILRNGIFKQWLDPETKIWGWCDADTYWGNFSRTFPWDIAEGFDILAPTGQPDIANQRLLFTRGHMAFFKNSPEVLEMMHSFPKFSSLGSYLTLPSTRVEAEESEFSHYMFSDNTNLTFLFFEGMFNGDPETSFVSERGVFFSNLEKLTGKFDGEPYVDSGNRTRLMNLIDPISRQSPGPTFTDDVVEKDARVFTNGSLYNAGLWFPKENATFVEPGWDNRERTDKGYFMRRAPGGPILQRRELRERYVVRDGDVTVEESLYKHWQGEKHEAWFDRLPPQGLKPDQMLVLPPHRKGVEMWDERGDVLLHVEQ